MPPDYSRLLQNLRNAVRQESEAQRQRLTQQWALPLRQRVFRGYAIDGLTVEQVRRDGRVILQCSTNASRFREGDFLILHRGNPEAVDAVPCILDYDDETRVEVLLGQGNPYFLKQYESGWIADESMLDLSPLFLETLDQVADTARGRERILPLLAGELAPSLDFARSEHAWKAAQAAGLNDVQSEAVAYAYASDLAYLIQGPPGTGKTYVLAHLARLLVEDGYRVLVTGLTHRAINNALNKLYRLDPSLPVCKVGQQGAARDLEPPNHRNFAEAEFAESAHGYVVGATPFATRSARLANVEFDVVIFDEASQITLPLAMMGMLAGQRYIFIGDDRQLPPIQSDPGNPLGRQSIFAYLNGRGYETMLEITYRLNDSLVRWPSRTFYEGQLQPAPEAARRRLAITGQGKWAFALDPAQPAVFLDLGHRNNTVRSLLEAEVVLELVESLLAAGLPPTEIGVVVPYRAQARTIRSLLRRVLPERETLDALVVDTVERMQGQEREVVLVSLTTSNPSFAGQLAEFFFQPQRLNVSITRPRTKLILIGSRQVLKAIPLEPEAETGIELLRDLLEHCRVYDLSQGVRY